MKMDEFVYCFLENILSQGVVCKEVVSSNAGELVSFI